MDRPLLEAALALPLGWIGWLSVPLLLAKNNAPQEGRRRRGVRQRAGPGAKLCLRCAGEPQSSPGATPPHSTAWPLFGTSVSLVHSKKTHRRQCCQRVMTSASTWKILFVAGTSGSQAPQFGRALKNRRCSRSQTTKLYLRPVLPRTPPGRGWPTSLGTHRPASTPPWSRLVFSYEWSRY